MEPLALDAWPAGDDELPRSLPRGPHGLPRDVVERSQRSRLLQAMVESAADKGYSATTVGDVISRAGVSRTTFYQQFRDKESCYLAAYQRGGEAQYRNVVEAVEAVTDPLEQVERKVGAYLAGLVAFPASARAFLLEATAAGPRALASRDELQGRYADLLGRIYGRFRERSADLPELPPDIFRAAVAAVDDLVVRWVREGRLAELQERRPVAVYVELALLGVAGTAGPPRAGG
jgi:AcrR family transcriptional regulator